MTSTIELLCRRDSIIDEMGKTEKAAEYSSTAKTAYDTLCCELDIIEDTLDSRNVEY